MAMMAASRPSPSTSRPAYLDRMFTSDDPNRPTRTTTMATTTTYQPTSPSLRSTNSSISFSSSASPLDFRAIQSNPRPLSPALEESACSDDRLSVRSLRLNLSPRHKLKSLLNRRTYPQIKETAPDFDADEIVHLSSADRSSLPKLHTAFPPHQPHQPSRRRRKPLPPPPPRPEPQELNCGRCYYFHARNCNGYVMGGSHGDACDNCAAAGFFGAP